MSEASLKMFFLPPVRFYLKQKHICLLKG